MKCIHNADGMLRSLDLFSGIGGITHGLRGFAKPIAYSEINKDARAILAKNIANGNLPKAPVLGDIRDIHAKDLNTPVDMIVGGFPCVGMSTAGSRDGFDHPDSALFSEILRLVDELKRPPLLFFENSPNILALGDRGIGEVLKQLSQRGYEVRYTVLGADQIGGPHKRNRWYCIALQPSSIGRTLRSRVSTAHEEKQLWGKEPARTVGVNDAERRARIKRLGHSVVPLVVRWAFCHLASGFFQSGIKAIPTTLRIEAIMYDGNEWQRAAFPKHGVFKRGKMYRGVPLPIYKTIDHRLVFDPKYSKRFCPSGYSKSNPAKRITVPYGKTHWATPTPIETHAYNCLTARSKGTLATQVRYEQNTMNREYFISPRFVEWLMGYPRGWTESLRDQ